MADASTSIEAIAAWKSEGVRFVRFELPDMHGTSRSKTVPIEAAPRYAEEGLNMYGGAGVMDTRSDVVPGTLYNEEVGYMDQQLYPDPTTAAIVPWVDATARFICDSCWHDGTPLAALPRHVFRRALEHAEALGYEPVMGFEPEFYLLDEEKNRLFHGYHIFNTVRNTYVPFVQELLEQLSAVGLDVITANCEYSGSQWEVNIGPGRGLAGPDGAFTLKNAVKELAHLRGLHATFMSKPYPDRVGCGCHVHLSLLDRKTGDNVFADPDNAEGISQTCRQFIAGQLRHARSVYCMLAPTVNCLKRRRPYTFSPTNVSWGLEDRSALIRVKRGSITSRHIENRAPSGMSNPYLVGAALLAAGLLGIEEKLELELPAQPPAEEDASKTPLPTSLSESLAELEADDKIASVLGDEFVRAYAVIRRHELQRFDDHVTDWELSEYMEIH